MTHPSTSVVARLRRERLLSIVDAVRIVRSTPICYRTGLRWCLNGINGVRLESVKAGGRRMTSVKAVERFFSALDDSEAPDRAGPTLSAKHRHSVADSVLKSHGLGRADLGE